MVQIQCKVCRFKYSAKQSKCPYCGAEIGSKDPKARVVHYDIGSYQGCGFKALCGRESPQCQHLRTRDKSKVTCKRCIELLEKGE